MKNKWLAKGPIHQSIILGASFQFFLLILWAILTEKEIIKPLFFPKPSSILNAYREIEPNIFIQSVSTLFLVISGFFFGTLAGGATGFMLRHSFAFRSTVTPLIESWRPIPQVAVIPFFILWFGFSMFGKIILISLGVFLIVVIGVVNGIDNLPAQYSRLAKSMGATNFQFLRYAAFPAILPSLLGPLRIAMASAITIAVVSEFMGSTMGIGYTINVSKSNFSTHTMLLCVILLGIMGGLLDSGLRWAVAKATLWANDSTT